jgi:hypothetical protein
MSDTIGPMMTQLLTQYGLESLAPWLSNLIINNASDDEIMLELYDQPAFKQRFPAIFTRQADGLPPLSPSDYLTYEDFAKTSAKGWGINISQGEINAALSADVSIKEMDDRMSMASAAVHTLSPQVRGQVNVLYGINEEDLVRAWLDPREQAPVLRKRLTAAQIAAEGLATGFGQLNVMQAERLAEGGIDADAARKGLAQLTQEHELFQATDATEADIGTDAQLGLLLGDQDLATAVERRAQRRKSPFESGGGFATGKTGVTGLGSAAR